MDESKKFEKKTSQELKGAAIRNIIRDRTIATDLLLDLKMWIDDDSKGDRKVSAGSIAAKYLETLQRSNEQLVKLIGIVSKKEEDIEETSEDELLDMIEKNKEEEKDA